LQFNDSSDYITLLGRGNGMVPSQFEGRGLVKIDENIFEYQTAYPSKWDEINTSIKNACTELNEVVKNKPKKIAVLPEHIHLQDIYSSIDIIKMFLLVYKKTIWKLIFLISAKIQYL